MSRTRLALATLLLAFVAPIVHAGDLIDLRIIDRDTGRELPEYYHRGDTWVPGTPSHRYAVTLTNTSDERLLVVLSVDGVNAISGETAATRQSGYVLDPGESAQIDGWRKSLNRVAQFVFTDVPDSYAARTGRPDNIGVIGAAVFRERRYAPVYRPAPPIARSGGYAEDRAASDAAAAPAAAESSKASSASRAISVQAERQRIGTGHGESQWSPVGTTTFQRASNSPAEVVSVRYDDLASLRRRGVVSGWSPAPRKPTPFPGGFTPDPPSRW